MVKSIKFLTTLESEILQNVRLKEVAHGIVELIKNAEDLLNIADRLSRDGRKERSIVLTVAALEECVKISYLVSELAGNFPKDKQMKKTITSFFWKKWKRHEDRKSVV